MCDSLKAISALILGLFLYFFCRLLVVLLLLSPI